MSLRFRPSHQSTSSHAPHSSSMGMGGLDKHINCVVSVRGLTNSESHPPPEVVVQWTVGKQTEQSQPVHDFRRAGERWSGALSPTQQPLALSRPMTALVRPTEHHFYHKLDSFLSVREARKGGKELGRVRFDLAEFVPKSGYRSTPESFMLGPKWDMEVIIECTAPARPAAISRLGAHSAHS